jgi:uncharacterized SAM-binding protein YcdF (DUF218 family)
VAAYEPVNLNPKRDADALFVLFISMLVMTLSLGVFLLMLFFLVVYRAKHAQTIPPTTHTIALVFGKRLTNEKPDLEYQARLNRLLNCPFQSAILMGGKTDHTPISEAQAGYEYLQNKGLNHQDIHLEQSSQNTLENLKNTRQLLGRQQTTIISNRYHLARCSVLASSLGIPHHLCAAENNFNYHYTTLFKCLLEAFYLHWFFSGKYWAILTKNQRMLDKIS